MDSRIILDSESIKAEQSRFITKVYGWMSFALVITGLVAFFASQSAALMSLLFSNSYSFLILFLIQLGVVVFLSARIHKMSAVMATGTFILYSVLTGLVLSSIFLIFTAASLASTFFVTAGTFTAMTIVGYFTKTDLTSFGKLMMMGLIGIIIASIVNIFLKSPMLYWISTYIGVLVFVGLIAYDTQKIKEMNVIGNEGTDDDKKEAIMGAFTLYLDFINLFIFLLRILGRRD